MKIKDLFMGIILALVIWCLVLNFSFIQKFDEIKKQNELIISQTKKVEKIKEKKKEKEKLMLIFGNPE